MTAARNLFRVDGELRNAPKVVRDFARQCGIRRGFYNLAGKITGELPTPTSICCTIFNDRDEHSDATIWGDYLINTMSAEAIASFMQGHRGM